MMTRKIDNQSPLVSVIVPVYNVEQCLRECLDSIVGQTYQNLEIILVNDGATDISGVICQEYAFNDKRIKVMEKANGGLSSARNAGLSLVNGAFVLFVDSDDWILPDTVSTCLEAIKDSDVDFCFFNADSFDETGYGIPQRYHRKKKYEVGDGITVLTQLCKNNEYHSSVNLLLYKTAFLKKNALSFYTGIIYEDMLFTFQVYVLASKVMYVDRPFYQRRYRSDSIMTSRTTRKNFSSTVTVYEQLLIFVRKHNLENEKVALDYMARCAFNIINTFSRLSTKDRIECKKQLLATKYDILQNYAFGNTSLRMRCHGFFPWFVYKAYSKTIGRFFSVE